MEQYLFRSELNKNAKIIKITKKMLNTEREGENAENRSVEYVVSEISK